MYKLKILDSNFVTHNVKRFIVEKPEGLVYRPGQSVNISLNLPGWENELRKFSFTSLNDWPYLEFIIKIYEDHHGVTQQLGKMNAGSEIFLHDVFGTIQYKGPGIFIAGGTGITPFLAIFRAMYYSGNLKNTGLIYSNRTQHDVILHEELVKMLGPAYMNVFTREGVIGFKEKRIDKKFLIENISYFGGLFYVCGTLDFTEQITKDLISLGARTDSVVI
ncbi:MAG: FAD-binding oxidoreductase [Weeksellaceae bacterium]|jgi:ferredoxin-NADP reductase|nr:FAD-binding oxidoreductase [Weeksellaceae bacterium]